MDFEIVKDMVENFFNGQYEVKKFLGAGSFAEVYLVNHKYLDDLRAIKIIKEPLGPASNVKKVFSEVMLATRLRHENIISIYDAGIISTYGQNGEKKFNLHPADGNIKDDWAYFIMEYVQGGDLQQYLTSFINSNISMPVARVLDIIRQILLGLNTLHSAKPSIVHRDLKPNNILLSFNSKGKIVIKISDFGFAREVSANPVDFEVAGNKNYMAPECFDKIFSTQTDIYAVGVIFYQILTGHCPYEINKFSLLDVSEDKPWKNSLKPPSHHRKEIPKYIDDIVIKCLEISPENRYRDAAELLGDVESYIEKYEDDLNANPSFDIDDSDENYSEYVINDAVKKALNLAKCENKLQEAIEILEKEILSDYEVRKYYFDTLSIWKSERPDIKLVSQAFTVNLKGNNYILSCNLLKEAIAYNSSIANDYMPYIDLWNILAGLIENGNLVRAVLDLGDLMDESKVIHDIYINIINVLKTYSAEEILNEALRLANLNLLADAADLMEFAVASDKHIRARYAYKLSLLKQNMMMNLSLGEVVPLKDTIDYAIDLGTTDSIIAYYNNGNPEIVKNHITGEDFTPSAVLIDEMDNIHVGENARDAIIQNSANAVSEFKNNMGFSLPFNFDKSSHAMLPEELSAEVLKDLRVSVYKQHGVNLQHAVITVPANSNPMKTKAVNDAAELAGFKSHNLILEPIAIAIAYGLNNSENNSIWMIYDLGGATFNVSLIANRNGEIQKIATAGLENSGGNLFDLKIAEKLLAPRIADDLKLEDFTSDNLKYSKAFSKLIKASESSKKELSNSSESLIFIENLFEGYDFRYTLTRDEFKQTIYDSVNVTLKLCRELLLRNSLDDSNISKVILAGGSSLSPTVHELVSEEFDIPLESSIDPLTAVAKGGAIYAAGLEKPVFDEYDGKFSVVLKSDGSHIKGNVFALDRKFSFLGHHIEFINVKDNSSCTKLSLNIDGAFKTDSITSGNYIVKIYDENDNSLLIDEKSPVSFKFNQDDDFLDIYIEFFKKSFKIPFSKSEDIDCLMRNYHDLNSQINELKDNYGVVNVSNDLFEYINVLMDVDSTSASQIMIYISHLKEILDKTQNDLDFSILVENIKRKINITLENGYFDIEDIVMNLESATESRNLEMLEDIYRKLIERYVISNRNDVVISCFFNLRFEGVFTNNKTIYDDLIKNGLNALHNSDFNRLFDIVNSLYELDERNFT